METWVLILISLCISALFNRLILAKFSKNRKLPPGPYVIPILGDFLWHRKNGREQEAALRELHARYGPIITLHVGSRPIISVADRGLAHKVLIQNGAVFADRPPSLPTRKIASSNQRIISLAFYGPTWGILRRNLMSKILLPSRVKSYSPVRKWVLDVLINRLTSHSTTDHGNVNRVVAIEHFRYAMFCLLVLVCFGYKLDETQMEKIARCRQIWSDKYFNILNFWPWLGNIIYRKRWKVFNSCLRYQVAVLMPLIEARKRLKQERLSEARQDDELQPKKGDDDFAMSYVDTLLDLELPEEKRKLNDGEVISLCSEFLNAGTDTTSSALQWIMANLVKYPRIQEKLFAEMKSVVVGNGQKRVKEEDLHKLPYLKAVVLEGLRRHPPANFLLPHAATKDVVLDGYLIPKNASLNFMVTDMCWDPKVWEDPMAFKPERFLSGENGGEKSIDFDMRGSREIKMMPFGAGRRICPGFGLAMLHLEYFVANLLWNFEWKAVDGDEVDLSEKPAFTTVMKYPLEACLSPRF